MKQNSHITLETHEKVSTLPGATLDFSFKNMRVIKEVLDLKQKKHQGLHTEQVQKVEGNGPQASQKEIGEPIETRLNIVRTIQVEEIKGSTVKQLTSQKNEKTSTKVAKKQQLITTNLFLRYNKLTSIDGFLDVIKELLPGPSWSQLMWVDLSHNRLTTIHPELQTLPQLKALYLHCNFIHQFKEFQHLQQAKLLRTFTIHGNPIENFGEFRSLLTAILPQLQKIDSVLLTKRQKQRGEILKKQGAKYPIIANPHKPPQDSESEQQK